MEEIETYVLGGERRPDPPRKRNYAGHLRRTRDRAGARVPPDLRRFPGLPAAAFAEDPEDTIYKNAPGHPYYADITAVLDRVDIVRASLSAALDRWGRIKQRAAEDGNEHIRLRAENELKGLHDILERLSCRCP